MGIQVNKQLQLSRFLLDGRIQKLMSPSFLRDRWKPGLVNCRTYARIKETYLILNLLYTYETLNENKNNYLPHKISLSNHINIDENGASGRIIEDLDASMPSRFRTGL